MPIIFNKLVIGPSLLVCGAAYHFCKNHVFIICEGRSMEPTIYSGDIFFSEVDPVRSSKLIVGDIVVAHPPHSPSDAYICKRVVGLPGDQVNYKQQKTMRTVQVPEHHVWLQGDNLRESLDSRSYGAVPYDLLHSRLHLRIWPPSRMGRMKRKIQIQEGSPPSSFVSSKETISERCDV